MRQVCGYSGYSCARPAAAGAPMGAPPHRWARPSSSTGLCGWLCGLRSGGGDSFLPEGQPHPVPDRPRLWPLSLPPTTSGAHTTTLWLASSSSYCGDSGATDSAPVAATTTSCCASSSTGTVPTCGDSSSGIRRRGQHHPCGGYEIRSSVSTAGHRLVLFRLSSGSVCRRRGTVSSCSGSCAFGSYFLIALLAAPAPGGGCTPRSGFGSGAPSVSAANIDSSCSGPCSVDSYFLCSYF